MQIFEIQGQKYVRAKDIHHPNSALTQLFRGELDKHIKGEKVQVDGSGRFLVPLAYIEDARQALEGVNAIFEVEGAKLLLKKEFVYLVTLKEQYNTSYRALAELFTRHGITILAIPKIFPSNLNYVRRTPQLEQALQELEKHASKVQQLREGKIRLRVLARQLGRHEDEIRLLCTQHNITVYTIYKPHISLVDAEHINQVLQNQHSLKGMLTLPEVAKVFNITETEVVLAVFSGKLQTTIGITEAGSAHLVDPQWVREWLGLPAPATEVSPQAKPQPCNTGMRFQNFIQKYAEAQQQTKPIYPDASTILSGILSTFLPHFLRRFGIKSSKEHSVIPCYDSNMGSFVVVYANDVLETIRRLRYPTLTELKAALPGVGRVRLHDFLQDLHTTGSIVKHGANKTHYVAMEHEKDFWEWVYLGIEKTLLDKNRPLHFRDLQSLTTLDHVLLRQALNQMVSAGRLRRIEDRNAMPTTYTFPSQAMVVLQDGRAWVAICKMLRQHPFITRAQLATELHLKSEDTEDMLQFFINNGQLKTEMGLIRRYSLSCGSPQTLQPETTHRIHGLSPTRSPG